MDFRQSKLFLVPSILGLLMAIVWAYFSSVQTQGPSPLPGFSPDSTANLAASDPQPPTAETGVERTAEGVPSAVAEAPVNASGPEDAVLEAQLELAKVIDGSLDGSFFINHTLDQVIAFAKLPVSKKIDFDYDDDEAVAFKILGTPPGTTAHFLVGLESFMREGQEFNYFQMEIQMDDGKRGFNRNAMREGPRIHLTLDYGEDGKPDTFALITERRVSLSSSREVGIDAYQGQFTSGAGFKVKMDDLGNPMSETWGIVNGSPSNKLFQGISPLRGALDLDPSKIEALFATFQQHYKKIQ